MSEPYIMKHETLRVGFAKTERAKAKIDDLNGMVTAFFAANPYKMVSHLDNDKIEEIFKLELTEPIPTDIHVLTGEILHNLRSPLDQVCCAIADQAGRSETGVCFPMGRNKDAFKASVAEQKKLPKDARDMILKTESYPGGNGHLLWAINELNRRDKHRISLKSVLLHSTMLVREVKVYDADLIRLGSRRGRHMLRSPNGNMEQPDPTKQPVLRIRDGIKSVEFGPLVNNPVYDDMEIMTTFPGANVHIDLEPTFNIAFSKVGVDGQPIAAVLKDTSDIVERLLLAFENRFFPT
jgi:hypothetical protein